MSFVKYENSIATSLITNIERECRQLVLESKFNETMG